jgi:ubiquinone/menaquinone biosynthesis C-methylase UbiE
VANEEYYSYIRKFFRTWSKLYDLADILIGSVRGATVKVTGAEAGDKILDVATGTGKQAFAFAQKGNQVVGIDLSEDMLEVAVKHNKYKNLTLRVADATSMPFNDNEFDISCISFALHDMPVGIREKVLSEMSRVTQANGRILIVDYNLPENKLWKYLLYHFIKTYESIYYDQFIKSDLKSLLEQSGIKVIEEVPALAGAGRIMKAVNLKSGIVNSK